MLVLATGGTIASIATPAGRQVGATGAQLLARAREVWPLPPDITVRDTRSLISSALGTADVHELADQCGTSSPVVITHGTDALEETALAISLFRAPTDPPVVLTGAQRPFDDAAPDGPRNLAAAIRWAASPAAAGTGVSVVFGDAVLPAVGVRKTHTLSLTGFSAPGRGPFAVVDDAGVRKFYHPLLAAPLLASESPPIDRVQVLPSHLGMSIAVLEAMVAPEGAALVADGMGAGNLPPEVTSRLVQKMGQGLPVAVTSRTGAGATAGLYAGGGADLARAGAMFAGDLSPVQARWVLAAALTRGPAWREAMTEWLANTGSVAVQA